MQIEVNINNKWKMEWGDATGQYEDIDSTKNWILWEKFYTASDTIREISFSAIMNTSSPDGDAGARFWIDDVYVAGERIGVEEKDKYLMLNAELKAEPNPFFQSTVISYQLSVKDKETKIRIYDISGKLVEETKENIIGKNLKAGIYFLKINNYKPIKIIKVSYPQ